MSEKTFTRAGISLYRGQRLFRFTNDPKRERVLEKNGHEDVQFWDLEFPHTKEQAVVFLTEKGLSEEKTAREVRKPNNQTVSSSRQDKQSQTTDSVDDDGFVEPEEEWIQVAMCRMAKKYPGLSASHLYKTVMLEHGFEVEGAEK